MLRVEVSASFAVVLPEIDINNAITFAVNVDGVDTLFHTTVQARAASRDGTGASTVAVAATIRCARQFTELMVAFPSAFVDVEGNQRAHTFLHNCFLGWRPVQIAEELHWWDPEQEAEGGLRELKW